MHGFFELLPYSFALLLLQIWGKSLNYTLFEVIQQTLINSVNLIPVYIESNLFSKEEIEQIIKPGVDLFKSKGVIPSNIEGTRSVGYDYGLFLYNMVRLNDPLKEKALRKMLSVVNSASAWDEYYDDDKSYNCRSRPWESGINIDALVEYIGSLK